MRRKQFEALVWMLIAVSLFIGGAILVHAGSGGDTGWKVVLSVVGGVFMLCATYISGGVVSGEDERWLD